MEDNFELNELDQIEPIDTPAPVTEEAAPVSQTAPRAPSRRRRRRKKRPTWQRLLWKYWPPIRFGLIILAGILVLWLVAASIGAMFGGEVVPTEPTEPSTSETTLPPEPETEPPTEPTEPPTTAPTAPPDPYAGMVGESWYQNTLFIGDFGFAGLRSNARHDAADYFATANMGVFSWDEEKTYDQGFDTQTLTSLLASQQYDKIIINMGINNCGYPTYSLVNNYTAMVNAIREAQPNAKIIIQAIVPVTQNYASGVDYFSASHIASVNEQLSALADGETVFYVDLNESLADSTGHLLSSLSTDGCHMTSAGYEEWAKLLGVALGKLNIG